MAIGAALVGGMLKGVIGPLADNLTDVWKEKIKAGASREEIRGEIIKTVSETFGSMSDAQMKVLVAEAQGESWLQRMWRPLTGASLGFTVIFYAVIVPVAVDWLGAPPVRIGDMLLEWVFNGLLAFGTVYAGGRSLEKIATQIAGALSRK